MKFHKIVLADQAGIERLSAVASAIIKDYYDPIIGPEQNDYMIGLFQSVKGITEQLEHGYLYYLLTDNGVEPVGFIGFYPREDTSEAAGASEQSATSGLANSSGTLQKVLYLSKFYLHKDHRGKGYGHTILRFLARVAKQEGLTAIELNVNKHNGTIQIYEHLGFTRVREEKNDIGNGFFMDDYVYRFPIENKNEILCSTGAMIGRPNGRDYRLLQEFVPKLACDGLEFMMYDTWYGKEREIVAFMKQLGARVPVFHCEKHMGELLAAGGEEKPSEALRQFEINCQMAQELGASAIVCHLWNGEISDRYIENNFAAYPKLLQMAELYGLTLLIENVICACEDPMTHWKQLKERYPDVKFVFDTKMADFHRQLELLYQPEYAFLKDAVCHYHVNDYGGGYMDWSNLRVMPIGAGHIDFEAFFSYLRRIGYQGTFTVESTAFAADGTVDLEMLNTCFAKLRGFLKG